jgi:KDO2-lipid IV(A) lauroyltransferase
VASLFTLYYWLWRLGSWLLGHLPRKLANYGAALTGRVLYVVLPHARRGAYANFSRVIGRRLDDPIMEWLVRRVFHNFAHYLMEVMRFPYVTQAELDERVVLHTDEHFQAARAQQKGIILVSVHFGQMELAAAQLARQYARLTLTAEVLPVKKIYDWLVVERGRHNIRMVPYQQAARTLITALRQNELVGLFLDLGIKYDHAGVPVQFFGRPTNFPAAPILLARHTGAPILPCYALVEADGRVHGYTLPPLCIDAAMDKDECVRLHTQQLASYLEQIVRQHPDQWYIFRRIWPDDLV